MASNHLYLVDGSSYIFRAYHRLPPLTNARGEPAGAVYGFTTMLWKLIDELNRDEKPTHLAVIFDAGKTSFRNELYDQYKANRPPAPEDLVPQFPIIRDATRAFSVPCIEMVDFEADDIIATYTVMAKAAGYDVTIVSSDKDLMQLIGPGIDMLDTMNNRRIETEQVIEKFGVGPELVGEVLALMGDSVDNVPGVPGVGPKTATDLIRTYGSLEAVLAAAPDIKRPKLRENLINHAENARLSRKLVELEVNVPNLDPLDSLQLQGLPAEPLRAFLEDQGFRSLLSKLGGISPSATSSASASPTAAAAAQSAPAETPIDHSRYLCITDAHILDTWIERAKTTGILAIDTETDSLDATRARLVGISLATAPGEACYIPLRHIGDGLLAEAPDQLDVGLVISRLKPLLEDQATLKIGHNIKYDAIILESEGIKISPCDDTMLISYALDAGKNGHGMDELAKLHLSHTTVPYKEICGTGKSQITFDKVSIPDATRYAAEDADITFRLWQRLKPRLPREAATRVYEMVDRPILPVITEMERLGIKVDREELARLSALYAMEMTRLEGEIHAIAGEPFSIGSPKQLGEILFDKLGLKGGKKGKSGTYSTDVTEMERLAADGAPIASLVLEWRQLAKLKSTYTDALQAQINPKTGRVHTSFSLAVAQTGRLSSTDPNLQNIPIRTEMGRRIRDAFVAEPGHVILAADYSQIELRIAAHMADEPMLKQAFADNADIHSLTAQELFGEVNRDTRARAKTINFAILYGISAFGLAGRLDIDRGSAQAMIDRYFERFPGIRNYIAETLNAARDSGFTSTLFGRHTHFPGLLSSKAVERQGAERAAINAPIQGTSADIIKRAMARMPDALAKAGLEATYMLLQVHDELVFEVREDEVERAIPVIREVMVGAAEPAITLSVPLGVEIGTGPSWGAAH